jgi:endonuclease/exonuclease/phosphatase family metal-dependent hydrolase
MLSLITWNIQWGLGVDGRVDLSRISSECARLGGADLLCFQEVADGFAELKSHDGSNQFAELQRLFPEHQIFEGITIDWPATEAGQSRRRFGNVILSRLPVHQAIRHALPWNHAGGEAMQRGVLEIVVETPQGPLRVLTTHLEWSSAELRKHQIMALRHLYSDACGRAVTPHQRGKGPYDTRPQTCDTILTGDFNMQPHDPLLALLQAPFESDAIPPLLDAWPLLHGAADHPPSMCLHDHSKEPTRCLDYIFLSQTLETRLAGIDYDPISQASDHQPVRLSLR